MELSTNRDLDIEPRPDIDIINRDKDIVNGLCISASEREMILTQNKLKGYRTYSKFD